MPRANIRLKPTALFCSVINSTIAGAIATARIVVDKGYIEAQKDELAKIRSEIGLN